LWIEAGASRLPLWSLQLDECDIVLNRAGERAAALRTDGFVWREGEPADRTRFSLRCKLVTEQPEAGVSSPVRGTAAFDGTINFAERWISITYSLDGAQLGALLRLMPDAVLDMVASARGRLRADGTFNFVHGAPQANLSMDLIDARVNTTEELGNIKVEGLTISFELSQLFPLRGTSRQRVQADSVRIGEEQELRDVRVSFEFPSAEQVLITELQAEWAGGHVRAARPIPVNPQARSANVGLTLQHVSLNEFVKLVSGGRARGEGSLSGEISVQVEWPRVTFGGGQIQNDGPGVLDFGEKAGDIAATIADREPRLKGQRQQILEALSNFQYDRITFEMRRTETGLTVVTKVAGRGRSGLTTPLDLTINLGGDLEDVLNTYLGTGLRVRDSDDYLCM
jgi:hypothetical protein